jgi:streptogramin lyase
MNPQRFLSSVLTILFFLTNSSSRAGDLSGKILAANLPVFKSNIVLYAAGESDPVVLAQAVSDDQGTFSLSYSDQPDKILYVIATGGIAQANPKGGMNSAIRLLAILGSAPSKNIIVNEFSTVASVWTSAQFLKGDTLSGKKLGLKIASGNVFHFANLETGSWGVTITDAINSDQTPTLANFTTLADLLSGAITQVKSNSTIRFLQSCTSPTGVVPTNTLQALESVSRYPWFHPETLFSLLNEFYPVAKNKFLRPTPFLPYLSYSPSAWVLPLHFAGGGINAAAKIMFDSEGNAWIPANFIPGSQTRSSLWNGNLTKFSPNGLPLSPAITGFSGGGLMGPGFGLCVDAKDQVWVTSFGSSTISLFDKNGKALSPPEGYNFGGKLGRMQGIIATPNGDIWAVDATGSKVVHFPQGDPAKGELLLVNPDPSKPEKNPYKLLAPFMLAVDQQNRIWIANAGGDWVTRFDASNPTKVESFKSGYSGSGLAIDGLGNVWIANRLGSSERGHLDFLKMLVAYKEKLLSKDDDGSDRLTHSLIESMAKQTPGRESGGSVTVYQPDGKEAPFSPIYGKGLSGPWSATVDGDDNVWISNFSYNAPGIVELCGARPENCPPGKKPGDAISPTGGYVGGGLQMQVDLGISPSGDVWVSNNWDKYQTEFEKAPEPISTQGGGQGFVIFFGLAKPVASPQIGPAHKP